MTVRSRLQRKVQIILIAAGRSVEDIATVSVYPLRTGPHQKSAGAWSWGSRGAIDIGSQSTMAECLRRPVTVSLESRQYFVELAGTKDGAQPTASFALIDAYGKPVWYNDVGVRLVPATAPPSPPDRDEAR